MVLGCIILYVYIQYLGISNRAGFSVWFLRHLEGWKERPKEGEDECPRWKQTEGLRNKLQKDFLKLLIFTSDKR